jgi:mycothiol system anti-sigma-R factor
VSCGNPHETPCQEVLNALFIFLDNEIEDANLHHAIEVHLQECTPCQLQKEYESQVLQLMKAMLGRSCSETAPEELVDRIFQQNEALADQMMALQQSQMGMQTQYYSEFTHTEITVDGVTQIIQTSHEIRRDFPLQ